MVRQISGETLAASHTDTDHPEAFSTPGCYGSKELQKVKAVVLVAVIVAVVVVGVGGGGGEVFIILPRPLPQATMKKDTAVFFASCIMLHYSPSQYGVTQCGLV